MNLVDEQHDVATRLDLFENLLQTLFEVAAVTATGNQCAKVKRVELLVAQGVGDVVRNDLLSKTFDDGGLADAGLANEHWVVLGATAEDLHHSLEFTRATNNRIELLLASELGEVAPKLIEDLAIAFVASFFFTGGACSGSCASGFARLALTTLVAREQLDHLLANTAEIGAELDEHLCGNAFALTDEAEQNVLSADVVMAQLQCFAQREFENFFGARGEGNVSRRR